MSVKKFLGDLHYGEATHKTDSNTIIKPRNASVEKAWGAFLHTLENAGLKHIPGTVHVIHDSNTHHEVEIVKNTAVNDIEDIKKYYMSCGCLLCLTWILGSVDLHEENLIAGEKKPVIIDYETLLQGTVERASAYQEETLAGSVTRTELLPSYFQEKDVSGFSGISGSNLPVFNHQIVPVYEYQKELICGFKDTFLFILHNKELFCETLHLFDQCNFRVIFRPTALYEKIIDNIEGKEDKTHLANRYLSIAYERDIDPNRLKRCEKCLRDEVYAVTHGWIPYFYTYGNSCDLYADKRQSGGETGEECVLTGYYRLSPVDTAIQKVQKLGDADLEKQISILKATYHVYDPVLPKEVSDIKATFISSLKEDCIPNLPSSYMMLFMERGRAIWSSIGYGLYFGVTGVLCALASLGAVEEELFHTLYEQLQQDVINKSFTLKINPNTSNLSDGVSGIIAGLMHIFDLTGDIKYKNDATQLLNRFEPVIAGRIEADILSGIGGLCLQLPKIGNSKAEELAEYLIPIMRDANLDLTGMAHGKAGLALTLGALQTVLNSDELDKRILELLEEENRFYNPACYNWRDLRSDNANSYMGGWCSGAPGIGMSRKKLMSYTKNESILSICRLDINNVKMYLQSEKVLKRDTLCCGNAARFMSASYLGVPADLNNLLKRSVYPSASHLFHPFDTADHNVSLMQGSSGVAYALAMSDNELCGEMLL